MAGRSAALAETMEGAKLTADSAPGWRRGFALHRERGNGSCGFPLGGEGGSGPAAGAAVRSEAATVLRQVAHQVIHALKAGAVVDEAAFLSRGYQPSLGERLQVERQRRPRDLQALTELASGKAFRTSFDQQPENGEARVLREGREGFHGVFTIHTSKYMEI